MKKIIFFIVIHFIYHNPIFSQKIIHNMGIVFSNMSYPKQSYQKYRVGITQFHYSYFPEFNLNKKNNNYVSVGTPLSIGLSIATNKNRDRSAGAPIALSSHLPVTLNYNFGKGSNKNNDIVGWFAGAGLDYFKIIYPNDADYINSFGPILRAGVSIKSKTRKSIAKGASFGLLYKREIANEKKSTIGFTFYIIT